MDKRPIMLVEDNPTEALLIERTLKSLGMSNPIHRAKDGLDAIYYLFGTGRYEDRSSRELPAVVLVDLNLPRMDGLELLRRMRADYRTKLIPVVIFTSSDSEQDLINGYSLGANSYVHKPSDSDAFRRTIGALVTYWTELNEPPPPGERTWAHHFDPFRTPA